MSQDRNALTVDVVVERMSEAERLLHEATQRVHELTASATVAGQGSESLAVAAAALEKSAADLSSTAASLDSARSALVHAMNTAQEFLASTDVSAVAARLAELTGRMDAFAASAEERALADRQFQAQLLASVNRVREVEAERDQLRQKLNDVMSQIPARVAKKIT